MFFFNIEVLKSESSWWLCVLSIVFYCVSECLKVRVQLFSLFFLFFIISW